MLTRCQTLCDLTPCDLISAIITTQDHSPLFHPTEIVSRPLPLITKGTSERTATHVAEIGGHSCGACPRVPSQSYHPHSDSARPHA